MRHWCLTAALVGQLWPRAAAGFFFGGAGGKDVDGLVKSDREGCLKWEDDTGSTSGCDAWHPARSRGHCACVWGKSRHASGLDQQFTCGMLCGADFPAGATSDAEAWVAGTVWNWNNWRDVELQEGGQFLAPTPECEEELDCYWAAQNGKVYILWGESGMHTVNIDEAKRHMNGIRYDGDSCTATFVASDDDDDYDDDDDDCEVEDEDEDEEDDGELLYDLLGVDLDASEGDIKRAFRQQSKSLHPDRVAQMGGDAPSAAKKFEKMRSAYEVLSNADTRHLYDTAGTEAVEAFVAAGGREGGQRRKRQQHGMHMFGGGGQGGGPARGDDMAFTFKISLADAYIGVERVTQVSRRVVCRGCGKGQAKRKRKGTVQEEEALKARCAKCRACPPEVRIVHRRMGGFMVQDQEQVPSQHRCREERTELEVHVEQGMNDGDTLVFDRRAAQTPGQVPGDIILQVDLEPSSQFRREGANLFTAAHVPLKEALTGYKHSFAHLDGHDVVVVDTPPGKVISPNELVVVKGEGMPLRDVPSERGDLTVEFDVVFPTHLDEDVKSRLRELLP